MGEYFELVFFIQLLKITLVEAFTKSCNASLQTVSIVAACPTNDSSYQIAAQKKNCSSFSLDSSSCESFQYHCVLSEDLKTAIEVCAPSLFIIGHSCAMFSNKLQSIMRLDNTNCGNVTEGCPYSYNSTFAFKYQRCFSTELHTTEATSRSSSSNTKGMTRESSNNQSLVIIIVPVSVVVVVIIGVLLFCLIRHHRKRRPGPLQNEEQIEITQEHDNQQDHDEQHQPLLQHENEKEFRGLQILDKETIVPPVVANPEPRNDVHDDIDDNELEGPVLVTRNETELGRTRLVESVENRDVQRKEWQEEEIESILDAFKARSNEFPAYKSVKTRKLSFNVCNNSMKMRSGEFARYGFFYEGFGSKTSCFHCGCAKEDWTDQDDIHSKHLELKETCAFVNYAQSILF